MTDEKKTTRTLTLRLARKVEKTVGETVAPRQRSGERARRAAQQRRVTTNQSASLAVDGEVKRGHRPMEPKAHQTCGGAAPTARSAFFTQGDKAEAPVQAQARGRTQQAAGKVRQKPACPVDRQAKPAPALSSRADAADKVHNLFAPCPQGLEAALVAELHALGYPDAKPGRAGAHFTADWTGVMRANLHSRLATRILVQVAHAPVAREDDILALASATPWERWFGPEHRLRVDTSAIQSPMQSLHYCNLRVKDGICDRLRAREGARPDIDTVRPDARVHLFLSRDAATLYLDTSGESLFKRGWRLAKGAAPLRENLAAGLLALSGWQPGAPLLDPFCGSGTLVIEAAGIALNIPPGINRPLGFERLRGHDVQRWQEIKHEAHASIRTESAAPLIGADIDPHAIDTARSNLQRAGIAPEAVSFQVADARSLAAPAPSGWIVTNPPYGERLDVADDALWRDWASVLKRHYAGWQLAIISNDPGLPQRLRLKPRLRTPVHNGALDCRLFQFELVAAGYRE